MTSDQETAATDASNVETLAQKVGRILWAGFPGLLVPERFLRWADQGCVGGAILFRRNIEDLAQTRALLSTLEQAFHHTPLLAVDQEGGRVRRLHAPVLELPPMRVLGDINDVELTERAARVLGRHVRAVGFNCDFAPVLDVDTNPENPIIGDRAFGTDVERVVAHAAAFARGLLSAGVLPCGKHFPGHGDTLLDSHLALPRVQHPLERLEAVELSPFRQTLDDMPMLMSAHVVFDALDPGVPATLSPKVITGLLRDKWKYDGVVVSDDLEMKAVSEGWGIAEAAVLAVEAGCDALLVCSDLDELERTHAALVERAESSELFSARITEASGRCARLTSSISPAAPFSVLAIDTDEEARALEAEIEDRRR